MPILMASINVCLFIFIWNFFDVLSSILTFAVGNKVRLKHEDSKNIGAIGVGDFKIVKNISN